MYSSNSSDVLEITIKFKIMETTLKQLFDEIVQKTGKTKNVIKAEVADKLHNTIQTINLWEKGKVLPSMMHTHVLAHFFRTQYNIDVNMYEILVNTYKNNQK